MISKSDSEKAHSTWLQLGKSRSAAAAKLGLSISALNRRLEAFDNLPEREAKPSRRGHPPVEQSPQPVDFDTVLTRLRKHPLTLRQIADALHCSLAAAKDQITHARDAGMNLHELGGKWSIEKTPALRPVGANARHELFSNEKNMFQFGFVTDSHLGSKHERLGVLNDLYDRFERRGITQVFHAGNYIDGEARFNRFELLVHGMDAQLKYLAENYPQRDGIKTYFIAGDDHEGWYGQREGVDIGRHTERIMREQGRDDFLYLGFVEADIGLINASTEKSSRMRVVHPGGGSAYATSYAVQKMVESWDGGDKPAVALVGHYHKMEILNYRNVFIVQGGTTKDQDTFLRKQKIEVHVGGLIVTLEQDPRTGAIISCNDMYRYFTRSYYDQPKRRGERFNYAGPVTMPERSLGGV